MRTDIKQMGCGACGTATFTLYRDPEGDLLSECTSCKTVSAITVSAKIEVKWADKMDGTESEGCLAIMPVPRPSKGAQARKR